MKLVLLRHGETESNAQHRFLGRADEPLNEAGECQAADAARALADGHFSAVYSSPLSRARETASLVGDALGVGHRVLDGLRERDLGDLEGCDIDSYTAAHGAQFARLVSDADYAPAGGETQKAVLHRVSSCLQTVLRQGLAEGWAAVLLVTHGGVLAPLAGYLGPVPSSRRVRNCHGVCVRYGQSAGLSLDIRRWDVTARACADWAGQCLADGHGGRRAVETC
ncbi:histidine phosphatase family protein [Amycolatopsis sp. NBC_00345]|uniref:histidine phosphatase family protein n=1 Tax=Amycolatopsis sp. NBC_00345 TaxID=2975955 RepID=UPI002E257175